MVKSNRRLNKEIATSVLACLVFTLLIFLVTFDLHLSSLAAIFFGTLYFLFISNKETANNLLHPYSYFVIVTGVFFYGLPVLLVMINTNNPHVLLMPTQNLGIVVVLITCSFLMYGFGYRLTIGRKIARAIPLLVFQKQNSRGSIIFSALVLYGIGWIARIAAWGLGYHHNNPDLGEYTTLVSSILAPLTVFCTLSYIVILWDRFDHAKKNRSAVAFGILVLVLIFLEVGAGMIQGSRSRMIYPLLFAALVYNYTIRRFKWRDLAIGFVVLVVVLAPASTVYRDVYFDALGERGASLEAANESLSMLSEGASDLQFQNVLDAVTGRLSSNLQGALVVYDKVPREINYAEGSTFFPSAIYNFIPRLIWPEKPIIMPGREFSQIFWGYKVGEQYGSNQQIGFVGEAYYNFGWFGLVVPMVFGIILKFFVVRLEEYSRIEVNWAPRLFFAVFMVNAIGVFHYYPTNVVRGALFVLLYLTILNRGFPRVLRAGRRRASYRRSAEIQGRKSPQLDAC